MGLASPIRAAEARPASAPAPARARPRPARLPYGALQAKLALGPPTDAFEREADSAAAHVVAGRAGLPSLTSLGGGAFGLSAQRACSACKLGEDESRSRIQRKCAGCGGSSDSCSCAPGPEEAEHEELQVDRAAKRGPPEGGSAIRGVEDVVSTPGRPLPAAVRQDMERGFGRDFGRVRIHDSPRAAASAEGIGAHAYTVGNHIAFNRGQFRPDTESGRFLLAHELAHTIQQGGAPPARMSRISSPADRHEIEANRAAKAAVTGSPMPALTPGGAPIGRYSLEEFGSDLLGAGEAVVGAGEAVVDAGVEFAGDVADEVADAISGLWDTAVAIAEAVGGAVSLDGTTLVIDVPQIEPCPEIEFGLSLSDIGLDPSFYFPIVAGGLTIGVVSVIGLLGITANVDPGFTFRLEGCSFGPGQIRIRPLPPRLTVSGAASFSTAAEVHVGADLGLNGQLVGAITIPDPPIVLIAPIVGLTAGGTMALMLQHRGTVGTNFNASMGLGGVSAATSIAAQIGFGLDFAYGLFGAVDIMGFQLCRVGWPLGDYHDQFAAALNLDASISVGTGGISFGLSASASPIANPLDDLSFAFDQSRLEDDCWLCDFFRDNNLLPGQNGYNWANMEPQLPRLGGPRPEIYARDPQFTSGALCRGTCGVDCPPEPSCDTPYDMIVCRNEGEKHYWYTYENYATCGSAQGCKDHDACYDYAATMPIWGFGGVLIGPMYRACDLEAMCNYSFQQGVRWAMGEGPYDSRLLYADQLIREPGCFGPCPQNVAPDGEAEVMQTCLEDRELWAGLQLEDAWEIDFGNQRLFQGFVEVPWIGGVHYGVDAAARADADAFAELGPINLEGACLTYDPATQSYTGSASLVAYLNGGASASISAALTGWLADLFCLAAWVSLRGTLSAGAQVQLPTEVRGDVDLYCEDGDLQILPSLSLQVCPQIFGDITAQIDVYLLSFNVWSQQWPLIEKTIERCWEIGFEFDPFSLGQMPDFRLVSAGLELADLLLDLFEPAGVRDLDRRPARNPIADPSVLLPCLGSDDDDDGPPEVDADCPRKATGTDGDRLFSESQRAPTWGPVNNLTITTGATAGVGTWMEVQYLTSSHGEGEETNDSVQRGIYKQPGLPTNSCVGPGYKQSQVFIKGHLLNANVGGPAEERNLFPITGKANSEHKNQVEQRGLRVVPRVNTGNELLYYKVTVGNVSAPREIMTSAGAGTNLFEIDATFHCEVADYQYCTNDTVTRNPMQTVDIQSSFIFHPSGGRAFDTIMRPCPRS